MYFEETKLPERFKTMSLSHFKTDESVMSKTAKSGKGGVSQDLTLFQSSSKLLQIDEKQPIFSKEKRFGPYYDKKNSHGESLLNLSDMKSARFHQQEFKINRSTNFGFGDRTKHFNVFEPYQEPNALVYPPPNQYKIEGDFKQESLLPYEKIKKGKTFGISFQFYDAQYTGPDMLGKVVPRNSKYFPGPGSYTNLIKEIGSQKPKYTIQTRQKNQKINKSSFNPPAKYNLNHSLTEQKRFEKIGLGKGQKSDFTVEQLGRSQGPAAYNLGSCFVNKSLNAKLNPQLYMNKSKGSIKLCNQQL